MKRKILTDLLAVDKVAQQFNCGLNPKLKRVIEADLRFPTQAAVPLPTAAQMAAPLPDCVTRIADRTPQGTEV